ncbi:hypothetical protein ILUMI_26497 [Ignelater luminosus]|uniref:HTH psq-type domain-containing protein n=1 Tax=Ignelater luminosus TaxID=2038154 RepID=A0A8K0FVX2_IGNLU|nr:hypothetical protein ILUMI_26497 [Ignelater luminosus]
MPRNYKRKTNRQSWSADRALQEVLEERMGYKKAARTFSIPQSTLEDRVKKVRQRGLPPAPAAEKSLGRKKKQVGCLSSAERGVLVTAEACTNAVGNFMPPMFVFPRKRENSLLMDDAPPGSFAYYHESGWINAKSFLYWFRRFIQYANPSPQKPVLLIF